MKFLKRLLFSIFSLSMAESYDLLSYSKNVSYPELINLNESNFITIRNEINKESITHPVPKSTTAKKGSNGKIASIFKKSQTKDETHQIADTNDKKKKKKIKKKKMKNSNKVQDDKIPNIFDMTNSKKKQ